MTVQNAAKSLGVTRVTLSNLLNGKSELSPDMAMKLEKAFGLRTAKLLLDRQNAHLVNQSRKKIEPHAVPPFFMEIKADQISETFSAIKSRIRLAVFLRRLVCTTGRGLEKADFPGNESGEKHGFDGEVIATTATPFVPGGHSIWEFGTDKNILKKIKDDYTKRTADLDSKNRKEITYVAVTPHNLASKKVDGWAKEKKELKEWKDVRVYDAQDLEQWLEFSISAQSWFASEAGLKRQGTKSLEKCYRDWQADCDPELPAELFKCYLRPFRDRLEAWLNGPPLPLRVAADSMLEGAALIYAAVNTAKTLDHLKMRLTLIESTETLECLLSGEVSPGIVPLICDLEVEKAMAPFRRSSHSIVVVSPTREAEFRMRRLASYEFDEALSSISPKLTASQIRELRMSSGRSPTVLRRLLSGSDALGIPPWFEQMGTEHRALLKAGCIFGAWDLNSQMDRLLLTEFTEVPDGELEERLFQILDFPETPVWNVESIWGVTSKVDLLHSMKSKIRRGDLNKFFELAYQIMIEDDPRLELADDERWAAGFYGKTREVSDLMRNGIGEFVVLFSGRHDQLGINEGTAIAMVDSFVRKLTKNWEPRSLESQNSILPLIAEASPDQFLAAVEADLEKEVPCVEFLFRPHHGDLSFPARLKILEALEIVTWLSSGSYERAVRILAKLSCLEINDNWAHTPFKTLQKLLFSPFRTNLISEERLNALISDLHAVNPQAAWALIASRVRDDGIRLPLWRTENVEKRVAFSAQELANLSFKYALVWANDKESVGRLIEISEAATLGQLESIWSKVRTLVSCEPDDSTKIFLRDKIQSSFLGWYSCNDQYQEARFDSAKNLFIELEPDCPISKVEWVFRKGWVPLDFSDLHAEMDFREREALSADAQEEAFRKIWEFQGFCGALKLAHMADCARRAGWLMGGIPCPTEDEAVAVACKLIELEENEVLLGLLARIKSSSHGWSTTFIQSLIKQNPAQHHLGILLHAPFDQNTWSLAEVLGDDISLEYWRSVEPKYFLGDSNKSLRTVVRNMLRALRPMEAMKAAMKAPREIPANDIYSILVQCFTVGEMVTGFNFSEYNIRKFLEILNLDADFTSEMLAWLELKYNKVLHRYGFPNIVDVFTDNPELFIEGMKCCFIEQQAGMPESEFKNCRDLIFLFLEKIKRFPHWRTYDEMHAWINVIRKESQGQPWAEFADYKIGKILARSPEGKDSLWPNEKVRAYLEECSAREEIDSGFILGGINRRGAHISSGTGKEEKQIASIYHEHADSLEAKYPNTARLLRRLANNYSSEAVGYEKDSELRLKHQGW